MPKGHRPSSLPWAQFCSLMPVLGAQHGGSRAALVSSAFHARQSQEDGWEERWARLTDAEQEEVLSWKTPSDFITADGEILSYNDAQKEVPLGLKEDGTYAEKDDPEAVTGGTADMLWVTGDPFGGDTVYLADIKRGWFTQSDPSNLQNLAYGLAAAAKHECENLVLGLWYAEEGSWRWDEPICLTQLESVDLIDRVVAAALNDSGPATGDHCNSCYQRTHCPEWMIPTKVLEAEGAEYVALAEGELLSNEDALELRRLYERGKTYLDTLNDALRAYVRRNGPIEDPEAGKVWGVTHAKGRVSVDKKLLLEKFPDVYEEVSKRGASIQRYEWRKK